MKKDSGIGTNFISEHSVLCSVSAVLLYGVFQLFLMLQSGELYYIDTDCYTRYLRIIDWLDSDFSWFEKIFPYTNCPWGEILHFTRINDILWLICSLPFLPFLPINDAVFAGGLIFSPLLFIVTLSLIMSGLRRFTGEKDFTKSALFVFILSFIFLAKTMMFELGRPDHHSLMLLIAAFVSVNLLNFSLSGMFLSGLAAAFGIWASSAPEGLLLAYSFLAVLVIGEIFYKQDFLPAQRYTLGLFSGLVFAYILNPPYGGYFHFDNTRLSFIHVVMGALTFFSFSFIKKCNPQKIGSKIALLTTCVLLSLVFLLFCFGFDTIFAPIYNKKIAAYFVANISEMQPLLAQEYTYLILGFAEILLLYKYFKGKSFSYIAIYTLFLVYLPLSIFVRRFLAYEILFYTLITALLLIRLFNHLARGERYKWATLTLIAVNLFCSASFSYLAPQPPVSPRKLNGCALTDIFSAPQLIYKTGIKTIGSPYHNNLEGIIDTIEIFSETDESIVLKKLKNRGARYVIISKKNLEYLREAPKNSFYKRLLDGEKFTWLKSLTGNDKDYLSFLINE